MPVAWQFAECGAYQCRRPELRRRSSFNAAAAHLLNRTPIVPAADGDIMARVTGYPTIADIIADDQQAVTYQNTKIQYDTTTIPNIKHGAPMTQTMFAELTAIEANGGGLPAGSMFAQYERWCLPTLYSVCGSDGGLAGGNGLRWPDLRPAGHRLRALPGACRLI